jgi:predicted nucleotide-binding protein
MFKRYDNFQVGDGNTFIVNDSKTKYTDKTEQADSITASISEKGLKVFIVHGHDDLLKYELKNYIQNTLKLPEPIILSERPSHGLTIIENFEENSKDAGLVFVLLTPDDFTDEAGKRARQNVIFELGYFMGKLGRKSGKIILLYKGNLEIPSDLSGIMYIKVDNGIRAAGEDIRLAIADIVV